MSTESGKLEHYAYFNMKKRRDRLCMHSPFSWDELAPHSRLLLPPLWQCRTFADFRRHQTSIYLPDQGVQSRSRRQQVVERITSRIKQKNQIHGVTDLQCPSPASR